MGNGITEDNDANIEEGEEGEVIEIERSVERSVDLDEEAEEEEEDVEPKLTYERIGHDAAHVMKSDTATCLTLHERVM